MFIIFNLNNVSFIEKLKTPFDSKSQRISDLQVHFKQALEHFAFMSKKNDFLDLL